MNILIIGQTTLHWGRMEFGNIGNYYIIEPFIRELHRVFDNANISTTLQMSDEFCHRENIQVLPIELYYDFNSMSNLAEAKDELIIAEQIANGTNHDNTTPYIDAVLASDIVIDFSGDIWGDNADLLGKDRFEVGLYKDLTAQKLKKTTFLLAGSPGPFNNINTRELAKEVFKGFTAVTNREPISTCVLKEYGFDTSNVHDLACPAFLFEPAKEKKIAQLIEQEEIISHDKPTIGYVLCGWNFTKGPFSLWPREDADYDIFVQAIEYISCELGARVCLLSHSNGFPIPPEKFQLIHGRDYPITKQLERIVAERGIATDVFALDGVYDAWTTKAIIARFDMLISGRIHAATAGFSQYVPTVVIDYGHEPKAHKSRGFATVAEQEKYVADPAIADDLIEKISSCWLKKDEVKRDLKSRMPLVKELAKDNFRIIQQLLETE